MIDYANEFVALTVSDLRHAVRGKLVDQSADLVVLYDGTRFMYVRRQCACRRTVPSRRWTRR
jgi:hypothetical protein